MRVKIVDENRMRNFINMNTNINISDKDFKDWLEYLKEYANFIDDIETEDNNVIRVRQTANLTLVINDDDYEAEVNFDKLVDNNGVYFKVDMNYECEIDKI